MPTTRTHYFAKPATTNARVSFVQAGRVARGFMYWRHIGLPAQSTRAARTNMSRAEEHINELYSDLESEYMSEHILPLKLNESWAARRLMEALSQLPPHELLKASASAPMRFQQKTQDEQEQRRQELNLSTVSTQQTRAVTSRNVGNGKVRQMFDERRRGAGIDRSNPLKPIGDARQQQPQQLVKNMSTMSLKEKSVADSNNNNSSSKYNTANSNRLKPVITRKTPPIRAENQLNANSSPLSSARRSSLKANTALVTATAARPAAGRTPLQDKARQTPPATRQVKPKSPVTIKMSQPPPEGTSICRHCGRHFNTDRLGKHETVCQRTLSTKRKIFDASKQRVKGTDSEKYTKQQQRQKQTVPRSQSTYSSAAQQQGLSTGVKSNWRRKHEEFIQAIRAAKQVQAHLARGGKLSDLPPPPPSENPDYIQCPHCSRRFNQQAAERHIPRCATMIHNKPRRSNPQVKKR